MRKANDLSGNKYGLLIVKSLQKRTSKDSFWNCLCDCGTLCKVSGSHLRRRKNPTKSCGCLRSKFIDISGKRFGSLVALDHTFRNYDGHRKAIWRCRCDCGNETQSTCSNLKRGISTSCGCSRVLPNNLAPKNQLFGRYKRAAGNAERAFSLSFESFCEMIEMSCFYCGLEPSSVLDQTSGSWHSDFRYNGIDRVDNSRGYIDDNVIPCCSACNMAKGFSSFEDFNEWLDRVAKHRSGGTHVC